MTLYQRISPVYEAVKYEPGKGLEDGFLPGTNGARGDKLIPTHWQPLPEPPGESALSCQGILDSSIDSRVKDLEKKLEKAVEVLDKIADRADATKTFIPGISRPSDFCDAQALKIFVAEESRACLAELEGV